MLYDKLLEIGVPADWRLVTDEYKAFALGAFVVVAILIWNRIRILKRMRTIETRLDRIETQLTKMQNEINTVLQIQVPLIAQLNPKSRTKLDPAMRQSKRAVATLRSRRHRLPPRLRSLKAQIGKIARVVTGRWRLARLGPGSTQRTELSGA
jgi:chaperonin cofactor prefoldin